jgi:hypothetical protein
MHSRSSACLTVGIREPETRRIMKCEFDYEVDELNLAPGTRTRMTRLFINVPRYMMLGMTGYPYCNSCGMGLTTV